MLPMWDRDKLSGPRRNMYKYKCQRDQYNAAAGTATWRAIDSSSSTAPHHHCLSSSPSFAPTHSQTPLLSFLPFHPHHHPIHIPILCFLTHRTRTIPHFQSFLLHRHHSHRHRHRQSLQCPRAQPIKLSRAMAVFYALQRTSSHLCHL